MSSDPFAGQRASGNADSGWAAFGGLDGPSPQPGLPQNGADASRGGPAPAADRGGSEKAEAVGQDALHCPRTAAAQLPQSCARRDPSCAGKGRQRPDQDPHHSAQDLEACVLRQRLGLIWSTAARSPAPAAATSALAAATAAAAAATAGSSAAAATTGCPGALPVAGLWGWQPTQSAGPDPLARLHAGRWPSISACASRAAKEARAQGAAQRKSAC